MDEARPRLFISRCLGFEHCRWNGEAINDEFVRQLEPFVEINHECPEMAIGLGCPRNPVRVVRSWAVRFGEEYLLKQVLFQPYPLSLVEITDSGKGRSY